VRYHLLHNYGRLQPEVKGSNLVYKYRIIILSGNYQPPVTVYGMNLAYSPNRLHDPATSGEL
jgi:hypothetical protein